MVCNDLISGMGVSSPALLLRCLLALSNSFIFSTLSYPSCGLVMQLLVLWSTLNEVDTDVKACLTALKSCSEIAMKAINTVNPVLYYYCQEIK